MPRHARVLASFALVLTVLAHGALGCRSSSSSSGGAPGPAGGTPSTADVRARDGGVDFVLGDRLLPLPSGEIPSGARANVMQDEGGKRHAYVMGSGEVRLVLTVGGNAYLGPTMKAPIDFRSAPDLDHSLGAMFDNAGERRGQLLADVAKDKGDAGVVRMLVDGASTPSKDWDEAFAKLAEPRAAEVKKGLAARLERGAPTAGLQRAVALVPLRDAALAPVLAARVRELSDPVREPRAAAVMLRALVASGDKAQAAQIGCEVLDRTPLDTSNAKGSPEEIDRPGREALVDAALLAIATAGTECAHPHVAAMFGDDPCLPYFRCNESGPLSGRETSKQDEPLCTKEQLARAMAKELERTPADVLAITGGPRPQLFAYASLMATGKVPATFGVAHARRRYAVVQPKEPSCESGVAQDTPCHCDEATLRDQSCRQPVSSTVRVGVCKFDVDDKQKKLLNVVAALPP